MFRSVVFRQVLDLNSSTFSYLVGCPVTRSALLIDSTLANVERDASLIRELGLNLEWTIETHVHADHITGASALREKLGSKVAVSKNGQARGADLYLSDGDTIAAGNVVLECRETPGHTDGCMSFVSELMGAVFTGDALLIRGCGRTDFQQGSARGLYRSIRDKIFSLPDTYAVFPGHDYSGRTMSTVSEERNFNSRVGSEVGEQDFVLSMKNLHLPHPKLLEEAVPANLECGKLAGSLTPVPDWDADLQRTLSGHFEVAPQWLEEHLGDSDLRIIDVRTLEERPDSMGCIPGSELVPLDDVAMGKSNISADENKKIVFFCRSGARSAQACVLFKRANPEAKCASLANGMLRWNREGREINKRH